MLVQVCPASSVFHTPPVGRDRVDVRGLEHDLRDAIEGEVRFTAGDRALYSATGANYRQLPIGVVIPLTADDVVEAVRVCRDYDAPLGFQQEYARRLAGFSLPYPDIAT